MEIYVCCSQDRLQPECIQLSNRRTFTYKTHQQASPSLVSVSGDQDSVLLEQSALVLDPAFPLEAVSATGPGQHSRSAQRLGERSLAEQVDRKRSARAFETSNLSSFVDTECTFCHSCVVHFLANHLSVHFVSSFSFSVDERQCKIRVVERLSEFHHAIWTTASPAELLGVPIGSTFLPKIDGVDDIRMEQSAGLTDRSDSEVLSEQDELALTDSTSATLLGLDDSAIETLSDKDLEQLSEKLLERVVRQLVTVAHTSEELLDELNSLDETGLSLLHYVSFYNYSQLVPLLLSHGAQINQQSTQGQTALHLAAGCGHKDVVDVLVQSGADLFTLDFNGFAAADRAEQSGHAEAAAYLRRLMGFQEADLLEEKGSKDTAGHAPNGNSTMEIDFRADNSAEIDDISNRSDEDGSQPSNCESPGELSGHARPKNFVSIVSVLCLQRLVLTDDVWKHIGQVGGNHEHNRKLLLGAFSTMSLHDKCALSLSISRDSSTNGSRRRGSSVGDDAFLALSVGGGTPGSLTSSPAPESDLAAGNDASMSTENDSLCDSDVKSVIADDEESLTKLEAAMELMGPEERQSLEDEVKLLQHNIRAWLLKRNYKNMRETTKRLHEATKSIEDQQKQQEQQREASEREVMQQNEMSERERAAVTVQAATRSMLARKSFLQTKNVTIRVQAATRGVLCRKNFARMKTHALASLVIQRNVREWWYKQPGALKGVHEADAETLDPEGIRSANDASKDEDELERAPV